MDSHKHANTSIYERAYERDSHKHANSLIQGYMSMLMRWKEGRITIRCGAFNLRLIKLLKKSKLKEIKQIWCHNISKYILLLSMVISLKNTVCLNIFWIFNIASTWHHLVSIATNCADLQVFTELLDFYKLYAIQVFLSGLHKICSITLKSWYFVV